MTTRLPTVSFHDLSHALIMDAPSRFVDYVSHPETYWNGALLRQANKLEKKRGRLSGRMGLTDPVDIARAVWELAATRAGQFPPVYVTGLGGSGSHWVAEMLGELDGFVNCGEVYFPAAIVEHLDTLDEPDRNTLLDAIHLLHGWTDTEDGTRSRMVNSAAGSKKTALYKRWDPQCGVVYLVRDPRDQVLSTAFRKDEYRQWVDPGASDHEYLVRRVRINRADAAGYSSCGAAADAIVRYEDLKLDTRGEMGRLLAAIGSPRIDDEVAVATGRHDAAAIRAGEVERVGNLDLAGGPAEAWNHAPPDQVALMHAGLGQAIEQLGYPFGSCLLDPIPGEPVQVPTDSPGVAYLSWDQGWSPARAGHATTHGLLAVVTAGSAELGTPVDTLCLSRLRSISAARLEHMLDLGQPRQVDLGTVILNDDAMALLYSRLPGLTAVNLWDVVDEVEGRRLRELHTQTLVVF